MRGPRILIFDDPQLEPQYARAFAPLVPKKLVIEGAPAQLLQRLSSQSFDCLLTAVRPPHFDGLSVLRDIRQSDQQLPCIIVAEAPTAQEAAESMRLGVGDLVLAADDPRLAEALQRLLQFRRLDDENQLLRRQIERPYLDTEDFVGGSDAMQKVFATIRQVAASDVDVLVLGETGTGKELVARGIHRLSRRVDKPFVPIDCGAIPEHLIESELFGHERGAFTGADQRRIGLLEFADGGTVFLDELGELPLLMQAKFLRTLQERKIRRVGGREEIDVNLRVVAATSRNLEEMIRAGHFREDLYYRVNVVRIDLPPLRERGDDLGLLAEYFALRLSRDLGQPPVTITPEAFQVLKQYDWPGNVRQLQNVIRRAIALSTNGRVQLDNLPDEVVTAAGERTEGTAEGEQGFFQLREEQTTRFEREYLHALLARHKGSVKTAAIEAKIPRGTLYRLIKNHGLEAEDFRPN